MKQFKQPSELAKQHFDRCVLIKIYFAARERSSYFGRLSRKSVKAPSGLTLCALTFRGIQRQIESHRSGGQGSAWYIFEWPALAFMARERSLIVYDISTEELATCKGPLPSSALIGDIATELSSRGDWVRLFDVPNDLIGPAPLPFRYHTSFSAGRHRLLGWRPQTSDPDMTDSLRVVARFVAKIVVWRQALENGPNA